MTSVTVQVKHELGLHLRAAARLATLTATATGPVRLTANAVTVDGKSLLGITSLLAGPGTMLTIEIATDADQSVLQQIVDLIENDFDHP